jgi:hypothetical protein
MTKEWPTETHTGFQVIDKINLVADQPTPTPTPTPMLPPTLRHAKPVV